MVMTRKGLIQACAGTVKGRLV